MLRLRHLTFLLLLSPLIALAANPSTSSAKSAPRIPATVARALERFDGNVLKAHDRFLSSDLLEGRGPGTRGGEIAMSYIAAKFEALGLKPDGDNGTYFQKISLLGLTLDPEKNSLSFAKDAASPARSLKFLDDFVGIDESQNTTSSVDSDLLFVGHGVVAPEYRWDDYKGIDVRGKTLIMLVDDPPATAEEPGLFKGRTRTYYGRWTYKYEIGTAKGAKGVILIHTNDAAGYPWSVVRNSWGQERSRVRLQTGEPALRAELWITEVVAAELFKAAGYDLGALTNAAASRDFKPVALGYRLMGTLGTKIRSFDTANVVAKLVGSDPKLRDEAVLYTAHHDHLGKGKADATGDTIYNGAIDNASGCAVLLEIARVWAGSKPAPRRSIIFASVAAEEQGLLGSAYYGEHPTVPTGRIALNINYDSVFEFGRVRDVTMNGVERTTFLPTAERVTAALALKIVPDQEPEQGHYYRSDHFSLGKVGIPAFSIEAGREVIGKPEGWGEEQTKAYREHNYHQPSDEWNPNWDWSEGVQMAQLGYWLGWEAANAATMPNWLPGDEFRAARDASLSRANGKSAGRGQ